MAEHSLFPSFGVLGYESAYGAHKQTLPTTLWQVAIGTNGYGGYTAQDGVTACDAQDIWTGWCNVLKVFFLATTTLKEVVIYNKATPTAPAIPQTIIPLNVVGTNGSSDSGKAIQQSFNGKSVTFNPFKVVLLDTPLGASFNKILHAGFGANDLALEGYLTDLTHPFAARDTTAVRGFANKTLKLNDKLRKEYGMA